MHSTHTVPCYVAVQHHEVSKDQTLALSADVCSLLSAPAAEQDLHTVLSSTYLVVSHVVKRSLMNKKLETHPGETDPQLVGKCL